MCIRDSRRTAAEAIAQGLAVDGGLMTPEVFPKLSHNALDTMRDMSYQQRAVYVMNSYLDDFTASELSAYADKAYGGEKFDVKEVAPVRAVDENTYCLELWHGPTLSLIHIYGGADAGRPAEGARAAILLWADLCDGCRQQH